MFGVLTIAFASWRDALFIGILVANIATGSVQEIRSKRELDRLAALVAPEAAGAGALLTASLAGGKGLPSAAPKAIGLVVLWFVLGYLLVSVAYAAVARWSPAKRISPPPTS